LSGVITEFPMPTYDIEVTRDGRWWMFHIPALDGLTQARFRGEIEEMAAATSPSALIRPSRTLKYGAPTCRLVGNPLPVRGLDQLAKHN
jgi:hypothetical protein